MLKKYIIITLICSVVLSGCTRLPKATDTGKPILKDTVSEVQTVENKQTEPEAETPDKPETPADKPETKPEVENTVKPANGKIIVIDPGHGKASSLMSDTEKADSGFTYVEGKGWGDWRHFKSGTLWQDCNGSGCSGRAPANGGCWYPIGYGDRNTEPDLNYNNALNAKKYLEQLGYTVRITRSQNENPSLSQRLKMCYPGSDISAVPDAAAYVCLHSNAGGGKGSCYISLSGVYDQAGIPANYTEIGNELGRHINESIVSSTSMSMYGNGRYNGYPELVLFCKSPVPIAYLEIGFYDNQDDLNILRTESEGIGKAIAEGIHSYFSAN